MGLLGQAGGPNPTFDQGGRGGVAPLAGDGLGGHFWRRDDGKEARPAARDVAATALLLRFDAALSFDMLEFCSLFFPQCPAFFSCGWARNQF